uniref:S-type pyocin domain-containing protein n=1 Tax=Pseudomonas capsici TaxID=2810614 RepID=UPI00384A83C9
MSELAAGAASGFLVGVSALIYPSELGNGELPNRYALTLPLTDLTASPITEINHGPINISVRIGFKPASSGHTEVIVIPADGVHVSRSVRVIAAVYDSVQNVYSVSTPDYTVQDHDLDTNSRSRQQFYCTTCRYASSVRV